MFAPFDSFCLRFVSEETVLLAAHALRDGAEQGNDEDEEEDFDSDDDDDDDDDKDKEEGDEEGDESPSSKSKVTPLSTRGAFISYVEHSTPHTAVEATLDQQAGTATARATSFLVVVTSQFL